MRRMLLLSPDREQKKLAPRIPLFSHQRAIVWAIVDLPVPARPLIHRTDLLEGISMSNGASVESLECCLHTRSIQEYTEARSSTRVDGAQSFRPWLVSNLACPAYRNPGITADFSQSTISIKPLFLTSSQALNDIIASLVYLCRNLIDFCLDIKHDVAHVLDPCNQHLLVEYPRIEIPRLQYKKTCSQRAVIMPGLV